MSIEKSEERGLCKTCNNTLSCVFCLKNKDHTVWHCELFDITIPCQEESFSKIEISDFTTKTKEKRSKVKGLCVNCDNYNSCTYPKPEGGIWHCEEYC